MVNRDDLQAPSPIYQFGKVSYPQDGGHAVIIADEGITVTYLFNVRDRQHTVTLKMPGDISLAEEYQLDLAGKVLDMKADPSQMRVSPDPQRVAENRIFFAFVWQTAEQSEIEFLLSALADYNATARPVVVGLIPIQDEPQD